MSKKKEAKKSLQKRLCAIVEIYIQQAGKENQKQLKDFINLKIQEIITFQETLDKKEKKVKKKKRKAIAEPVEHSGTPVVQPSASLVDELHQLHKNNGGLTKELIMTT